MWWISLPRIWLLTRSGQDRYSHSSLTVSGMPFLYLGCPSGITAGAWLFCPKMYNVVPVTSVKASLVVMNYLYGDLLAGRVVRALRRRWERTAALLGCSLQTMFVKEPRLLSCDQEEVKHERCKSCSRRASCGHLRVRACPLGVGRDRSRLL